LFNYLLLILCVFFAACAVALFVGSFGLLWPINGLPLWAQGAVCGLLALAYIAKVLGDFVDDEYEGRDG
jgi:hypothetical protein